MFITVEGIEGAGKSSQLKNIVAFFKARGYDCVTTREPGGTDIGTQIRRIVLDPKNSNLDARAELLLYIADRIQHIQTIITPSIAAHQVVICDRYFDATLVYQGYARGLDTGLIQELHRLVCNNLTPDLTLLFDLAPQIGLTRAWQQIDNGGRTGLESRFEQEKLAFHEKVRAGYLTLARNAPQRFRIIDAQQDEKSVARCVKDVLTAYLDGKAR